MKRLAFLVVLVVAALSITAIASSAPGKLKCFSGSPGTCSVSGDTVTLNTSAGGFAGAYITNTRNQGASLGSVVYSFNYNCDPSDDSTSCVGGGSPRWSIPVDTSGKSKTDGYAFLDAAGCGSTGSVSTADSACHVNFQSVDYANWAAFAAAHPTYTISKDLPFVITDTTEPGTTLISAITTTKS